MVSAGQAATLRRIQAGASNLARGELARFVGSLDLSKPEKARDALLTFAPLVARQYGTGAASVAAEWYDQVRAGERTRAQFRAQVAEAVTVERVERAVRFSVAHLFSPRPELLLPSLSAPIGRYAVEPARLTIARSTRMDPDAYGWGRRAASGACRFCRVLEAKGRVYRRSTADFAAHNDCNCVAVPSFNPGAPEVPAMAYMASVRSGGLNAEEKAKRNAKIREWMDAEIPPEDDDHDH